MKAWSWCIALGCIVGFPTLISAASPESESGVVTTSRKSITYIPIIDRGNAGAALPEIEQIVRQSVEQVRFDINDLGRSLRGLSIQEIAEIGRDYIDRLKLQRATEQADFDLRFKDKSVTAEDLRRIADSAYLYRPVLRKFDLRQETFWVQENDRRIPQTAFRAAVAVDVTFFHLQFTNATAIEAFTVSASGDGYAVVNRPIMSKRSARASAKSQAFAELRSKLQTRVRALPPFQLKVNVERAEWNGVWFPLTAADGLQLDTLLRVEELTTSDQQITAGYVLVREVAETTTETQSYAQLISVRHGWTFTGGEMLFEVAQRGYGVHLGVGTAAARATDPSGALPPISRTWGLGLFATKNLAPAVGLAGLHATLYAAFGVASPYSEGVIELGVEQRWSYRRLFVGLGARLGALRVWTDIAGVAVEGNTMGVHGDGRLGIWLTPQFSLEARAGYRAYAPIQALLTESERVLTGTDYRYLPVGGTGGLYGIFRF